MSTLLVFDNGSGSVKAGVAGDRSPKVFIPNVVGTPKSSRTAPEGKDFCVGEEAIANQASCSLTYPIDRGYVKSFDDMEKVWHQTYNELKVNSEEHPILLSHPPLTTEADRQKMVQIMFETFQVPSMSLVVQQVLALYAAGLLDGVVLDSGYGVTHAVPCDKGFAIPDAVIRLELAGQDLTAYLMKILNESGYPLSSYAPNDVAIARDIKEKLCYVTTNFEGDLGLDEGRAREYKLPDGKVITFGKERFRCTEPLFNPSHLGIESNGIHKLIQESINKCSANLREAMYSKIVVCGGNTLFNGFSKRLEMELQALVPKEAKIEVIAPPTRAHSVWIGGSILGALPTMKDLLITKQAYEETGPSIASRIE